VHGKAALILPCLDRAEVDQQAGDTQGVTVEDSMSMVHMSAGINPRASPHLLSEPAIVARPAETTLPESTILWRWLVEDYDRIRERSFSELQPSHRQTQNHLMKLSCLLIRSSTGRFLALNCSLFR